jgi:hypothetical protein
MTAPVIISREMSATPSSQPTPHDLVRQQERHDILPGYEVLDFIGRGGMGIVFKARQTALNRVVAVKLLALNSVQEGMDFAARFKVEAQSMARLSHPNIVPVHDFGTASDGHLFYVMEYVEGTDLARRIENKGRLPMEEALPIMLAVCDALVCAHGQGVVHRDIKPSNILISQEDKVMVADFGLAKIDAPETASLTLSGTSMGSQGYAAPEVFSKAGTADHRADIYSLGVLLYQMLTGDLPRGMFKLPSEKVLGLDPRFDALICQAMEEDREDRQQSVTELRTALKGLADGHDRLVASAVQTAAKTVPTRRLHRYLAAAAVLILSAVGFWLRLRPAAMPSADGWQDALAEFELKRHQLDGYWKLSNAGLANRYEIGHGVVELPISPAGAYDLRVRLTCLKDGGGHTNLLFRYRDHAGDFLLSDYGSPHVGLGYLDGKKSDDSGAQMSRLTRYLPLGQARELLLQVREEGLALRIDGEELFRWTGDWGRVTQDTSVIQERLAGRKVFGIYVHTQLVVVHEVAWREASGPLPEPPALLPPKAAPITRDFPLNGHRYQLVPGYVSWKEASNNAKSMGGHLVSITSEEENQWLWRTFSVHFPSVAVRNISSRGWWTGGTQRDEGQPWTWDTGEPFDFTRWGDKEPARLKPGEYHSRQRDNGGGGDWSQWSASPSSSRGWYLVEWDHPAESP